MSDLAVGRIAVGTELCYSGWKPGFGLVLEIDAVFDFLVSQSTADSS